MAIVLDLHTLSILTSSAHLRQRFMKQSLLVFCLLYASLSSSQLKFDIRVGSHHSYFDGMGEGNFHSYTKKAMLIYSNTDSHVFYGDVISKEDRKVGYDFSIGLKKELNNLWQVGMDITYSTYRNQQLRDCGLTDNYPFKLRDYPNGLMIYEGFTFKDNFVFLSPVVQYSIIPKLALSFSPSLWKREAARYEGKFLLNFGNRGAGQNALLTNPDHKNYGFALKGGVLFYPKEKINFGLEYCRFMSAINAQSQIEKNFYTSWNASRLQF